MCLELGASVDDDAMEMHLMRIWDGDGEVDGEGEGEGKGDTNVSGERGTDCR